MNVNQSLINASHTIENRDLEATPSSYRYGNTARDPSEYARKSKMGQGKVTDKKSTANRDDIMKGVRETLLKRMEDYNEKSRNEVTEMKTTHIEVIGNYRTILNEVKSLALQQKEIQEQNEQPRENESKLDRIERNLCFVKRNFDIFSTEWESKCDKYADKIRNWNKGYDEDAMRYYTLVRKKDAGRNIVVMVPPGEYTRNQQKNIQAYAGYTCIANDIKDSDGKPLYGKSIGQGMVFFGLLKSVAIDEVIQAIKNNPTVGVDIEIQAKDGQGKDLPDHVQTFTHIKTQLDVADANGQISDTPQNVELDQNFNLVPDNSSRGAAVKDLTVNRTYGAKDRLITSNKTLNIHTVKLKGITTGYVKGVTMDGEFIPSDSNLYNQNFRNYASRLDYGKLEKGGRYALQERIYKAIVSSPFFFHVYSENIEHYMGYPDDTQTVERTEAIKKETAMPQNNAPQNPAESAESYNTLVYADLDNDALLQKIYWQIKNLDKIAWMTAISQNTQQQQPTAGTTDVVVFLKTYVVPKVSSPELLITRLVALQLMVEQEEGRETAFKIIELVPKLKEEVEKNKKLYNSTETDWPLLMAACEKCLNSTEGAYLEKSFGFVLGDGIQTKGSFNKLINLGTIQAAYNTVLFAVKAGNVGTVPFDQGGGVYTAFTGVLQIVSYIKKIIDGDLTWGKNEEHQREKFLDGDVSGWDSFFDTMDQFIDLLSMLKRSVMSGVMPFYPKQKKEVGTDGKELDNEKNRSIDNRNTNISIAEWVSQGIDSLLDLYAAVKSCYYIHKYRKRRNRLETAVEEFKTIMDNKQEDQHQSLALNPQIMLYAKSAKHNASKEIGENSLLLASAAFNIAATWDPEPISKAILSLAKFGIGTLGKLISNGVYNSRETRAILRSAFSEQDAKDFNVKDPFESELKKTTGIKSRKDMNTAARIMTAIDTHVLLRDAPYESAEYKLAKKAIDTIYNIKPADVEVGYTPISPSADKRKGNVLKLNLSDLLKPLGVSGNWREQLSDSIS